MSGVVLPSNIIKDTYTRLENFRKRLDENIVTDDEVKRVIDSLKHESNILKGHKAHSDSIKEKIAPVDEALKKDVLDLINAIHHSPSCNQALGSQQLEFSNLLKRFETIVQKWESKVEKIDKQSIT